MFIILKNKQFMKYPYIAIIIAIIFASCNNDNVENFLKRYPNNGNYKTYMIIPSVGCSGCISNVETFVKKNYEKLENTKFFLIKVNSYKSLKLRFGKEFLNQKNVEIISIDGSKNWENNLKYPVILHLNENEISSIKYF